MGLAALFQALRYVLYYCLIKSRPNSLIYIFGLPRNIQAGCPVFVCMSEASAIQPGDSIAYVDLDLGVFDQMLRAYVNEGVVDYPSFASDARFADFVSDIGRVDKQTLETRQEKLSFYINAYNALVIKGIIDGLSPASLLGRLRFFILQKYRIAGENLSLLAIERRRIIPLGEPRSHFAINCASASCPALASETYASDDLDQQLEQAAEKFVQQSTSEDGRAIKTSRIFKWYRSEFERNRGGLRGFLSRYSDEDLPEKISYDRYDWSLNGKPPD